MRGRWSQGTQLTGIRTLTTPAGGEGIVAQTSYDGWQYRLAAVRLGSDNIYRFLFAARNITAEMNRQFLQVVASLRHLSDQEAEQAAALKIETMRVRPGETVATLAARMPGDKLHEEQFRVLNGLGENEQLRAGQWVKLVSE